MAIRSDVVVDHELSPRIADITSSSSEITVQDSHDTLAGIQDTPEGQQFPDLVSTTGKEDLGGGIQVGLTTVLKDVQYAFQPTSPRSSGSCTSTNTNNLVDSAATFLADGVLRGDWVINFSDQSVTEVIEVVSETSLITRGLRNGTLNVFTSGDAYKVWEVKEVSLEGGNFVAEDSLGSGISPVFPSFGHFAKVTASSSGTLAAQEDIFNQTQELAFGDEVFLDVIGGASGQALPIGSAGHPSNNFTDAEAIRTRIGLRRYKIINTMVLGASDDISGLTCTGINSIRDVLVLNGGVSNQFCLLENLTVTGTFNDRAFLRNCNVSTCVNFSGGMVDCYIVGNITMDSSTAVDLQLVRCVSGSKGTNSVTIDVNGANVDVKLTELSGRFILSGVTQNVDVAVDFKAGRLEIDSSCTAGTIVVYGGVDLVDNSAGSTVVASAETTLLEEVHNRLDLDSSNPNTYNDDNSQIASNVYTLTKTDNGNGTFTVNRS